MTFPRANCDPADINALAGSYSFDGNVNEFFRNHPDWQDHPTPGVINDAVFKQHGGKLEFEVPSASMAASEAWKTWHQSLPNDRSWKISAKFEVPDRWTSGENPDYQNGIGLFAGKPGGYTVFEIDFLAVAEGMRAINSQNIQDRHGGDPNYVVMAIPPDTARISMQLMYCDSDNSVSIYFNNDQRVDTQPIGENGLFDWSMSEQFDVGIIGFSEGPASTSDLLSADDWKVYMQD